MSQKALFPMQYLNITQGYGVGTHKGTYAIDNAGRNTGIDNVVAPFDCKVKKIWNNGNNEERNNASYGNRGNRL